MLMDHRTEFANVVLLKKIPERIIVLDPYILEFPEKIQFNDMEFENYKDYDGNQFFDTLFSDLNEVIGVRLRDEMHGVLSIPGIKDIDPNYISFTEEYTSIFFGSYRTIDERLSDQMHFFLDVYTSKKNGLSALVYPHLVLIPASTPQGRD